MTDSSVLARMIPVPLPCGLPCGHCSRGERQGLPEDKLQDIIPKLNKVTGMPVISPDSKVIGVISRKVRGVGRRCDQLFMVWRKCEHAQDILDRY